MIDAYKIGVSIAMSSNASAFFRVLQKDLFGLQKSVDLTTGKFNAMAVAAKGAMAAVGGGVTLDVMAKVAAHGAKLVDQEAKLLALGVSRLDVLKAAAVAYKAAQVVPGTTPDENLKGVRELYGVFGNVAEAGAALVPFLQAQQVLRVYRQNHPGATATGSDLLPLLKALDIQGALVRNGQLSVSALSAAMREGVAALTLSNGILKPTDLQRFVRLAGPAAAAMDWQPFIRDFTEVMMALGPRGGRGLQMAAKTFLGGQLTKANVTQLEALGLITPANILNDHGHYALKAGTLKGWNELLNQGFARWFHDVVQPAMKAHHFTGPAAVLQALSSLPVTEQGLFSFLYTNWAQVARFARPGGQFDKAIGIDQSKILNDNSPIAKMNAFRAAWEGLLQALGAPMVDPATHLLDDLTASLLRFERFAAAHPGFVKDAELFLGGTAAIAATGGTISLVGVGLGQVARVLGLFSYGTAAAQGLGVLGGTEMTAAAAGISGLGGAIGGFVTVVAGATAALTLGATKLDGELHKLFPWAYPSKGSPLALRPNGELNSHVQIPWYLPNKDWLPWNYNPPASWDLNKRIEPHQVVPQISRSQPMPVTIVGGHVATTVTNPRDIARATTNHVTNALTQPPSGPSQPDPRSSAWQPGVPMPVAISP